MDIFIFVLIYLFQKAVLASSANLGLNVVPIAAG